MVTPGDRLGLVAIKNVTLVSGSGTYIRQGHLYASILGTLCAAASPAAAAAADGHDEKCSSSSSSSQERWIISIQPPHSTSTPCPKVNMIILGQITRVILPTHAMVDIVAIIPSEKKKKNHESSSSSLSSSSPEGGIHNNNNDPPSSPSPFIIPLAEPFSGILRQQDLRPKSSLEIRIDECYHPGDVILARIHANGERDFILTTAESELGVIQAICERSGVPMTPISWKEMQCPLSKVKEGRKVAKPRRR